MPIIGAGRNSNRINTIGERRFGSSEADNHALAFEYDEVRREGDEEEHGIGYDQARAIWDDPDPLEIPAPTEDGPR
jgi:hypothetical protein